MGLELLKITLDLPSPVALIAYYKVLQLGQVLGLDDLQAEVLADAVVSHQQYDNAQADDASAMMLCCVYRETERGKEKGRCALSVQAFGGQETVQLPSVPDDSLVVALQQALPDMSSVTLMQLVDGQYQTLQHQRDHWKQEAGQLSLDLERQRHSMLHDSTHDALTGLPNRRLLVRRANKLFQLANRQKQCCCFVLMNVNEFKHINDVHGHQAGDLVLQEVAGRLSKLLRSTDVLVRLSGDEFAILLFNINAQSAVSVIKKLQDALQLSFHCQGSAILIGASFGLAEFPSQGDDLDTLMRRADVAMCYAKKNKCGVSIYDVLQDQYSEDRVSLREDLQHAIETDCMELYYQPQVHLDGNKRLSVEALIRWNDAKRGMVFPDQFIPLAEESGLIIPMTWWVLETAVKQCAAWHRLGLAVNVSINITAGFLQEDRVVERVADCIQRHGLPDNTLALEITENTLMDDPHQASKILIEFNAMKVDISIDDFGTGYSSLAYLKHLEVDELKIDRSFIVGMSEHKNDSVIVRSVIGMAHHMGLRVVAEGVEEREDWDRLAEMGCDFIQGYYISRPQPVQNTTDWLINFAKHGLQLDDNDSL
ncbi:bifunctional diguanylate cyclase/phosphodiesterase [Mariprofundus ferrooxydans]|nr:bifunctional diguanylate cyclase/phosphodiesterase [Mariprofundus ferrooxydans]